MQIREVKNESDAGLFLKMPNGIYKDDTNYIRPLDKDIKVVFDKEKNKFFRHGECTRWVLFDENDKAIGRVAAFINHKTSKKEKQPTGGIGFFECINNQTAANLLFDTCKEWLRARGMEAMDGPINFGERDSWWGLLVEGYTGVPYKMNYNLPYYQMLFEEYGFKTWFEQWCYGMKTDEKLLEKFYQRHREVSNNPDYSFACIEKSNLEKYAEDFRIVYNKAWAKHGQGKELESKQVQIMFKKMKPVIDENLIFFAYFKDEPVAAWISLPDINQIFKRFEGEFGLIQKLLFVYHLKRRSINKIIGIVFGVVPEHQGKGVDSFIIVEGQKHFLKTSQYIDYEMQWIGDFNPKMIRVAESLTPNKVRILKTYRYLFDRNKPFERHPSLV